MIELMTSIKEIHKNLYYKVLDEKQWQTLSDEAKMQIFEKKLDIGVEPLGMKNVLGLIALYVKKLNNLLEIKNKILEKEEKTEKDKQDLENVQNEIQEMIKKHAECYLEKNRTQLQNLTNEEERNKCNQLISEMDIIEKLGKEDGYTIKASVIELSEELIANTHTFYFKIEWQKMSAMEKYQYLRSISSFIPKDKFQEFLGESEFLLLIGYLEDILKISIDNTGEIDIDLNIQRLTEIKEQTSKYLEKYKNLSQEQKEKMKFIFNKIENTLKKYMEIKEAKIDFTTSTVQNENNQQKKIKIGHPFTAQQILNVINTYEKKGEKIVLKGTYEEVTDKTMLIQIKSIFFLYKDALANFESMLKITNKNIDGIEELSVFALKDYLDDFNNISPTEKGYFAISNLLNKIFSKNESHEFFIDFPASGIFKNIYSEIYPEAAFLFGENREEFFNYLGYLAGYYGYEVFNLQTAFLEKENKLKINVHINKKESIKNEEQENFLNNKEEIEWYATTFVCQNESIFNKETDEEILDEELITKIKAAKLIYNESKIVSEEYKQMNVTSPSMDIILDSQLSRVNNIVEHILNSNGNFQSEIILESKIDYSSKDTKNNSIKMALKREKYDEILLISPKKEFFLSYLILKAKEKGININKEMLNVQIAIDKKNNTLIFNLTYEKKKDLEEMDSEKMNSETSLEILGDYISSLAGTDVSEEIWKKSDFEFKRRFLITKNQTAKKNKDKEQYELTKIQLIVLDIFYYARKLNEMLRLQTKSYAENNEAGINYSNQEIDQLFNQIVNIQSKLTENSIALLPDKERDAFLNLEERLCEIYDEQYSYGDDYVPEDDQTIDENSDKIIEACYKHLDSIFDSIQGQTLTINNIQEFASKLQIYQKEAIQIGDLEGKEILTDMSNEIKKIIKVCSVFYYNIEEKNVARPVLSDLNCNVFDILNGNTRVYQSKIGIDILKEHKKLKEALNSLKNLVKDFSFVYGNAYKM